MGPFLPFRGERGLWILVGSGPGVLGGRLGSLGKSEWAWGPGDSPNIEGGWGDY